MSSIDSTAIELGGAAFDWALRKSNKSAVTLHTALGNMASPPCFAHVSNGKMADANVSHLVKFTLADETGFLQKGSILVMDRARVSYSRFNHWSGKGVISVARAKANMACEVIGRRPSPNHVGRPSISGEGRTDESRALGGQIVRLANSGSAKKRTVPTRLVGHCDAESNRRFRRLKSDARLSPATIADICKDCRLIESFFKALKRNMAVKSFLGASFNAVKIRFRISLIGLLLVTRLKFLRARGWALPNFSSVVSSRLASSVDLLKLVKFLSDPARAYSAATPPINRLF